MLLALYNRPGAGRYYSNNRALVVDVFNGRDPNSSYGYALMSYGRLLGLLGANVQIKRVSIRFMRKSGQACQGSHQSVMNTSIPLFLGDLYHLAGDR